MTITPRLCSLYGFLSIHAPLLTAFLELACIVRVIVREITVHHYALVRATTLFAGFLIGAVEERR